MSPLRGFPSTPLIKLGDNHFAKVSGKILQNIIHPVADRTYHNNNQEEKNRFIDIAKYYRKSMKNRFIYSIGQSIDGLKSDCQKYQTMEMIDSSHRNSNFNEFPEEEKGLVHLPNLKLS